MVSPVVNKKGRAENIVRWPQLGGLTLRCDHHLVRTPTEFVSDLACHEFCCEGLVCCKRAGDAISGMKSKRKDSCMSNLEAVGLSQIIIVIDGLTQNGSQFLTVFFFLQSAADIFALQSVLVVLVLHFSEGVSHLACIFKTFCFSSAPRNKCSTKL